MKIATKILLIVIFPLVLLFSPSTAQHVQAAACNQGANGVTMTFQPKEIFGNTGTVAVRVCVAGNAQLGRDNNDVLPYRVFHSGGNRSNSTTTYIFSGPYPECYTYEVVVTGSTNGSFVLEEGNAGASGANYCESENSLAINDNPLPIHCSDDPNNPKSKNYDEHDVNCGGDDCPLCSDVYSSTPSPEGFTYTFSHQCPSGSQRPDGSCSNYAPGTSAIPPSTGSPTLSPQPQTVPTGLSGTCAQGHPTSLGGIPTDPSCLVQWILTWAIRMGGGIAFLLSLYGAISIILAGGNPEKINEAKQIITSAVSGLIFIIISIFLLRFIGVDILQLPGFSK